MDLLQKWSDTRKAFTGRIVATLCCICGEPLLEATEAEVCPSPECRRQAATAP